MSETEVMVNRDHLAVEFRRIEDVWYGKACLEADRSR